MRTRFPLKTADMEDFRAVALKFILPGYVPEAPLLDRQTPVFAMGSCFAENIMHSLKEAGFPVALVRIEEAGNSPTSTERHINDIATQQDRAAENSRNFIRSSGLCILTVGVAVQMFLNGEMHFDWNKSAAQHAEFRMLTIEELCASIRSTISTVRNLNPGIHVVLTVSPIPLKVSPDHPSVFGQDCLSKSLLRVAVEKVLSDGDNLSYWPSFEIVRWLGGHVGPFFGIEAEDQRHVSEDILKMITGLFIEKYFRPHPQR